MKAPLCGMCGERHWSGQGCKPKNGGHRTIKSNRVEAATKRNEGVTKRDVTERNDVLQAVTDLTKRMDMWDVLLKATMRRLDDVEFRLQALESRREEDETQVMIATGPNPETGGPQSQGPMTNAERQRAYRERKKQKAAG